MRAAAPRSAPNAGLTLVEVLVAVSLLALLSTGMVMALQTAAGSLSQVRERLTLDRRIATANQLLYSQFSAVVPVTPRNPPNVRVREAPFFDGEPQQMRFVSSYSISEGVRGGLRIVELNVQQTTTGLRLILTESPYLGPPSIGRFLTGIDDRGERPRIAFTPVSPRPDSLIVADKLETCRFSYLMENPNPSEPPVWSPVWDVFDQIPLAIRLEMTPVESEARLQPVDIIAQVRARYEDPNEGRRRRR